MLLAQALKLVGWQVLALGWPLEKQILGPGLAIRANVTQGSNWLIRCRCLMRRLGHNPARAC